MADETMQPVDFIQLRELEIAEYEKNIAVFKSILSNLPSEWPQHLLQYREATDKHSIIGKIENLDDVQLLSQLWYADECYARIRTETLEMTKSKSILLALKAQV